MRIRLLLCCCASLLGPAIARAQAPPFPEPDPATRRHLAARRATGPIVLDGQLSEPDWRQAAVAADFVKVRPDYAPTTGHPSEVRVLFDDEHLYIGAFNRDSAGLSTMRMPDLRRDFFPQETDVFAVTIGPLGQQTLRLPSRLC